MASRSTRGGAAPGAAPLSFGARPCETVPPVGARYRPLADFPGSSKGGASLPMFSSIHLADSPSSEFG